MIPAIDRVHHDGSALYVTPAHPELGQMVTVRLRVPKEVQPERVFLRIPIDAEPVVLPATMVNGASESWWTAAFEMSASQMSYRWLLVGGNVGYRWITAAGGFVNEVTDVTDFKIHTYRPIPDWAKHSVAYQIFPDRFSKSERTYEIPEWAVPRPWDQHPEGRSPNTAFEYYGGDLWGIIDRLDHIQSLGANLIYTTPFFPARSAHRYDASTFDHVDPLLGGDQALIALVEAAHQRGMKVIGDITLNHTGATHEWFLSALDGDAEMRDFYYFNGEGDYVSWLGVKSLPKLNFSSEALRKELITSPNSVLRRYLKAPFHLDGWRVDVANMTARLGDYDQNRKIAQLTRWAVEQEGSEKILIGEHNHDAGKDLPGDGWFGNMNYTAFQRPVWSWLTSTGSELEWMRDIPVPKSTTSTFLSTLKTMHSSMPWTSLAASWNLLDSHDSPRIRTMVGGQDRHHAAIFLMCTLPGAPMIFAEDEIGAEGRWGEDSRTPFPWDHTEKWDLATFDTYRELFALRTSRHSLASGGLRFIGAGDEYVAFLRETPDEALLCVVARAAAEVDIDLSAISASSVRHLLGQQGEVKENLLTITFAAAGGSIWSVK